MLGVVKRRTQAWAHRKERLLPMGFNWTFVLTDDTAMIAILVTATLQRPVGDWPTCCVALLIASIPWCLYTATALRKARALVIWAAWMSSAAIFLFATSTPIPGDFAPLLLSLAVTVVNVLSARRGGFLATTSAVALLALAATFDRIDEPPVLHFALVGMGCFAGQLIRDQQKLIISQREMQAELAVHAAAGERRRILREVHDVIAHSLSVTLLHLTGARRRLERSSHDNDAIAALYRAERLGRQAMTDIRKTVGLLDVECTTLMPAPGVDDIRSLAAEFTRAGLKLRFKVSGPLECLSPASGLGLYRVLQESLSNVAKHAPDSKVDVALVITQTSAVVHVVNEVAATATLPSIAVGRGTRGMCQRVELLGGSIEVGPVPGGWSVRATLPVDSYDR